MVDFLSETSREPTWKEKVLQWLKTSYGKKNLLLALLFIVFLTFFFYYRDVRVDNLKIGTVSNRFVINQTDFTFLDKQATNLIKQQVKFDIGPIYRIDERTLHLQIQSIKSRLTVDPQLRERVPLCNYQHLNVFLDYFTEGALKARFTDVKTLKKIEELNGGSDYKFFGIASSADTVPASFWQKIGEDIHIESALKECLDCCVKQLESSAFIFSEDTVLENRFQDKTASLVPSVYTSFKAGNIILSPGDKVTERHKEIIQSMRAQMKRTEALSNVKDHFSNFLVAFLITVLIGLYFKAYHQKLLYHFKQMALLISIIIFILCISKGVEYFLFHSDGYWRESLRYPPIFVLSSVLIAVLINRSVAIFSLLFLTVISWFLFSFDPERFALLNLLSSLSAILHCKHLHRRRQIFTGILKVWLTTAPLFLAFHIADKDLLSPMVLLDLGGSLIFLVAVALLVILILPQIESSFEVITDMTLTEYLDPNNTLLRRLSVEAPGTYQHSLVVGHIAESAARAIGANDLFCRVASLYHDIGKLYHPQYFTENQLGGFNIHQLLTPKESAQVIISHAEEGVTLAKKYRLPSQFIDIIEQHHGTTIVYYFYSKQLELQKEENKEVDQSLFRYKGPKPHSKESAIIMIADSVEAASRSLESATEQDLFAMVDKIVREKEYDAQFDESQLTFEELGKIRVAIVKALMVSHHVRVKYPAKERQAAYI